ncbi:MAG TPA: UbiA-like polyprenyltransferase [Candidatus Methylacidiphilales bacterium]|jgi:4-hydroxybenzoate polyprenyltransferase|nr:UbiA-like polyprenyltransferase [Candidatus Methylacidiphilales bacterium]
MPSSVVMTAPPDGPRPGFFRHVFGTLELIKFSHSVFALPFALSAMLVAARGVPDLWTLLWILWCLVSARTAAMAFNRWADWDYDTFNPRTKRRSQLGTRRGTLALCSLALAAFVFGCSQLNLLCLALCPVACALILGYSLTKRFTAYSHAFLGLALAAAPMGAWAATMGNLRSPLPWMLAAAVWCWVFGFDLIYATQDVEFDRQAQLHSFPARHGVKAALRLARTLHVFTWLMLLAFGWRAHLGMPYDIAMTLIFFALVFEHVLCRSNDLARINTAFFQMNALVGLILVIGVAVSVYWPDHPILLMNGHILIMPGGHFR